MGRSLSLLVLSIVSLSAASVDDLTFILIDNGDAYEVSGCDTSASGALTIPATHVGRPVTSIGSNAFSSCIGLASITIPDSVTSIGRDAFAYCTSLTSIIIPGNVTTIGDGAFAYCTSLTSITLPDSVTSIGAFAFSHTSLNYIQDGNNFNYLLSASGSVAYLIKAPSASGDVTIPSAIDGAIVKLVSDSAFFNCTSLTSITLPNGVTNIADFAFDGCTSLISITLPDSITSIGSGAFSDTSLNYIQDGNNFNYLLSASGSVAYLIEAPSASGDVTIPSAINGAIVKLVSDRAFNGCTSLTSITIPESVTSIGNYAFFSCTSLTSITLPGGVTSIGVRAFQDCTSLTSITSLNTSAPDLGGDAFYNVAATAIAVMENSTGYGIHYGGLAVAYVSNAPFDAGRIAGQQDVIAAPNSHDLYTSSQVLDARTAGRQDVLDKPGNYDLLTPSQVVDARPGSTKIDVSGGKARITMTLEETSDLSDWSNPTKTDHTIVIEAPAEARFYRFKMK